MGLKSQTMRSLYADVIGREERIEQKMDEIISNLAHQICCGLLTREEAEIIMGRKRAHLEA